MKFSILLASVIFSVQAIDVYISFDSLSGTRPNTAFVGAKYSNEKYVPDTFDFRTFVNIEAPFLTAWNYTINGVQITNGVEDFCNPNPVSPGGIAVLILRYGLGFEDSNCPFERFTTYNNRSWIWAQAESLDLDDIFKVAKTIASTSVDNKLPQMQEPLDTDSSDFEEGATDPSLETGSHSMRRRRRDSSFLTIKLDTINECVDARFELSAEVD
ncbi:uncharacterized protein [Chelonus insularis]|uniref:uncharacterized protein n=1 Tax=Chelonus insularis TaxID=460826 RepID=UPI00158E063F|nr:uncharacterized protein LOC118074573 [Chelonus insularis]